MLATKDDIDRIYRQVLGRNADAAAYEYWLPRIRETSISTRQFLDLALNSDEYRMKSARDAQNADHPPELVTAAEQMVAGLGAPAEAVKQLGAADWFHSFALSDGTTIGGIKSLSGLQVEFDLLFGDLSLSGCSLLDIGAWNGAFSFEAKRRGAGRVLAVDKYTWAHAGFRGLEKFLYVRKDRGLDVEYRLLDVPEVALNTVGTFDFVLFLGVFYHLREPISIIDRLAQIVDQELILETCLDLSDVPHPAMRFYPGDELVGDSTNWWGPNRACIEELLKTAGFSQVRFTAHPLYPQDIGIPRGIFHARK